MEHIIEELEKMIIEIGNIEETKTYLNKTVFKNPQEIKNEVMELLNDRISELKELKGENNENRRIANEEREKWFYI